MTIMRIMCNDALEKRHWKEMSLIAGFDLTPNAGTSLKKLTMMGKYFHFFFLLFLYLRIDVHKTAGSVSGLFF